MDTNQYSIVTSSAELADVAERPLLLAGHLVYANWGTDTKPLPGYLPQRARLACSGLLAGLRKNQPKVFLFVDAQVLALPKVRCAFLLDAYLAWGLKQKGSLALIGGVACKEAGYLLDVLVFERGCLVALYDQTLPPAHSPRFALAIAAVLRRIQEAYPTARIVQAAPLDNWALHGVEYLGDKVLRSLRFRRLGPQADGRRQVWLPAAIFAILCCGATLAAIGMAWGRYSAAIAEYERAINDPVIARQGGMDANYLNLLQQRQQFMALPRMQQAQAAKLLTMIESIAMLPEVQIVEIKCGANGEMRVASIGTANMNPPNIVSGTSESVPDTWLRIALPKDGRPALEQAQEMLARLAASTNMSWRLVPRGWQEERTRRIFTLEGFRHA